MRSRERVLTSLEKVYRAAFGAAEAAGDEKAMARLDLEYQRDQIHLEVLLDIRDLLTSDEPEGESLKDKAGSLLERAQQIRRLTRLRP